MGLERLRKGWTPEDDRQLRDLARAEKLSPDIAKALSRTASAVRARAQVLGIHIRLSRHPTRAEIEARRKAKADDK
jgi:hypothetical protein